MASSVSSSRQVSSRQTGKAKELGLLGVGAYSMIYALSPLVAVKVKRDLKGSAKQFDNEAAVAQLLGRKSQYLIPYIYITPSAIFQLRATTDFRFIISSSGYTYEPEKVARWMGQLSGGVAFIERRGFAHGDLRPDNLLLDTNGNLRIGDLGCALQIGNRLPSGTEPFARMLSKEDGEGSGTYGWAGTYSENFAIGSIFYSLIRGHYPHANEGYSVKTLIDMYQQKKFARLTDSFADGIIWQCWNRGFEFVAELEQVFKDMGGGSAWYLFDMETDEWIAARLKECAVWMSSDKLAFLGTTRRANQYEQPCFHSELAGKDGRSRFSDG
ncbi:hypothetical protein MKZ38_000191 [Zalerion maritima]|uniref:Protein kinase domain-containing protein n=1 Tax=Zalerion maritima TaxID=339359 RepID=A0AAD5WLQ4_9PEZI|nr:hypothetical protein MKZ38_000191 [Zalerion maritima]